MKRKAFTLVEITVISVLLILIFGVVYELFSGTLSQFFKNTSKMTNLRAASLILERLKSDVRCAVIPMTESEKAIIEDKRFAFYTTSDGSPIKKQVVYTYDNSVLKREMAGKSRSISAAGVSEFSVRISTPEEDNGKCKFIFIKIVVDNEMNSSHRSNNSKGNKVELSAVLYPRFFEEALTDEERFWYKTREES